MGSLTEHGWGFTCKEHRCLKSSCVCHWKAHSQTGGEARKLQPWSSPNNSTVEKELLPAFQLFRVLAQQLLSHFYTSGGGRCEESAKFLFSEAWPYVYPWRLPPSWRECFPLEVTVTQYVLDSFNFWASLGSHACKTMETKPSSFLSFIFEKEFR